MFKLVNGAPKFYMGKVNGIGYTSDKERDSIIKQLKKDNPDIEIIDEKVDIDKELKKRAEELGKLNLTHSKTEFLQYLNGEKTCPELEMKKLKEENQKLKQTDLMNKMAFMQFDAKLIELESKLDEMDK